MHKIVFLFFFPTLLSCGTENIAKCDAKGKGKTSEVKCVEPTQDEAAVIAHNAGDLTTAQDILEKLIAKEPAVYFRYPRLASIYASQGGVDVYTIAQKEGSGSSSSGSGLQSIGQFLPTPQTAGAAFTEDVAKVGQAKALLLELPKDQLDPTLSPFGSSASFQLTLYQTAFSIMFMNQFAIPISPNSKKLDPKKLQTLSNADATVILGNLKAASVSSAKSNPQTAQKINQALDQIAQQPGTDDRDKIIAYINAQNAQKAVQANKGS